MYHDRNYSNSLMIIGYDIKRILSTKCNIYSFEEYKMWVWRIWNVREVIVYVIAPNIHLLLYFYVNYQKFGNKSYFHHHQQLASVIRCSAKVFQFEFQLYYNLEFYTCVSLSIEINICHFLYCSHKLKY